MNSQTEHLLNPPGGQITGLLQRCVENFTTNQVNLENVEDLSTACRLCATVTDQLIPVFSGEGLHNNLADMINNHLPVTIQESDELPVAVCAECAGAVLAWNEVWTRAARADVALRTRCFQLAASGPLPRLRTRATARARATATPTASACQQDRPTKNTTAQLVSSSTQTEFEAAPVTGRVPPLQACAYCHWHDLSDKYTAHLEDKHMQQIFFCDECSKYVSRKDFLLHMSLHVLQYSKRKYLSENANNDNRTEAIGPANNKRTETIGPTNNNRTESAAPANNIGRQPRRSSARNVERKIIVKHENESVETVPAQRTIKMERNTKTVKLEAPTAASSVPEPTTTLANKPSPNMKAEVTSKSTTNNRSEFSDHSDADEFAPLPNSVFEAIEDTQDWQSLDSEPSNGSEPQNQSTGSESENETPKKKNKKTSKKTRVCPICAKVYNASSSYFYHLKYSHKGVREHECLVCGKKFLTRNCLTQHMTMHTKNCDFECKVCGKRFRTNASLYIHEQSHTGVKTFCCDRCDVSFRWRTHLVRHMKRHAAEKAHVCDTCGRGFTIHCDLLRHLRIHQAGEYKCAQCGVKFAQLRYLKAHMDKKKHVSPDSVN